jgi:hypothetical protein
MQTYSNLQQNTEAAPFIFWLQVVLKNITDISIIYEAVKTIIYYEHNSV